jgi:DegV family protein with EDD domain
MSAQKPRRIAVVTDSTAYLPQDLVQKYDIHVVPLTLMLGDRSWRDNVDIDPPAFYQLLEESSGFPTTSQPNAATFQELFARLAESHEGIVTIVISDELSGTMDSAVAAAAELPGVPIKVIDSRGTSMMLGFPVLAAARVAASGGDLETVAAAAQQLIGKAHIYFVVDTLEYLHRGGRIGAAAKLLGSALNLKPILEIQDGIVKPLTKVRTRRKALDKLFELLEGELTGGGPVHMAVINVAASAEAEALRNELEARFQPVEIMSTEVSPVIGAHAGPGTVGVAFYAEVD